MRSFTLARKATADGIYRDEIVPVEVGSRGKSTVVSEDEGPSKFDEARLRALKPAFGTDAAATITAGNASSISDGAAAVLLVSDAERERLD